MFSVTMFTPWWIMLIQKPILKVLLKSFKDSASCSFLTILAFTGLNFIFQLYLSMIIGVVLLFPALLNFWLLIFKIFLVKLVAGDDEKVPIKEAFLNLLVPLHFMLLFADALLQHAKLDVLDQPQFGPSIVRYSQPHRDMLPSPSKRELLYFEVTIMFLTND